MISSIIKINMTIFVFVFAFSAQAQEEYHFDLPHFENFLTEQQIRSIRKNPDRLLKRYTQEIYRISDDGTLDEKKLEQYRISKHAMARARKIGELLAADLDGNGVITRKELSNSISDGRYFNRANAALLFLESDTDENDEVSFLELSKQADIEVQRSTSNRYHRYDRADIGDRLMAFDQNNDGKVTIPEVANGIDIIAGKENCSTICQD